MIEHCVLCGSMLIEHAHVEPRCNFVGPVDDRIQNIILLCPTCHTLFDDGFITIHPTYRLFVFSLARHSCNIFREFGHAYAHTDDLERIPRRRIEVHVRDLYLSELGESELLRRFRSKPRIQRVNPRFELKSNDGSVLRTVSCLT